MPGSVNDPVRLDIFQNIKSVEFPKKGRIGLILQCGRWDTDAGIAWQVNCSAGGLSVDAGTFAGVTLSDHTDEGDPLITNLAFNRFPPYNAIIEGEFGIAGNSGNRSGIFNFNKVQKARGAGSVADNITATITLSVLGVSFRSQWHFNFDTFKLPDDINFDPTFTEGTQLDDPSIQQGGEFLGSSPKLFPVGALLDTGTLFVPDSNGGDILISAQVSTTINTKTGHIGPITQNF